MKNRRKLISRYFKGRFIQETDYFYVFESKNGYSKILLTIIILIIGTVLNIYFSTFIHEILSKREE